MRRANFIALLICLAAWAFYLELIRNYPVVYWYDPYVRFAFRDQIIVGRWLPLTQTLIFVASKITDDLLVARSFLAMAGVYAAASMYRLAGRLFSPEAGLIAAAFFATNAMLVALAIVAYPDISFIGLLVLALALLADSAGPPRLLLGGLALNLACLTRYEGWLMALMFMAEMMILSLRTKDWKQIVAQWIKTPLFFGAAAILWTSLGFAMLEPRETQALDRLHLEHWRAFGDQFIELLRWQVGDGVLLFGLIGWMAAWFGRSRRRIHLYILLFIALDVLLIGFLQPWPFGNLRQTFVVIAFATLYAAYGIERLIHALSVLLARLTGQARIVDQQGCIACGAVVLVVGICAPFTVQFVRGAAHEPVFSLPAQVGAWLRPRLKPDDRVWVLTDDVFPAYALATYTYLPYDLILDHRFDSQAVRARLESARRVYVVSMDDSHNTLATNERALLADLESGRLATQAFSIGPARVWVAPADTLSDSP